MIWTLRIGAVLALLMGLSESISSMEVANEQWGGIAGLILDGRALGYWGLAAFCGFAASALALLEAIRDGLPGAIPARTRQPESTLRVMPVDPASPPQAAPGQPMAEGSFEQRLAAMESKTAKRFALDER